MTENSQRAHARIIKAIKAVTVGCTASYGGVARAAGMPGRARLVGWILRNAVVELPWHRIVRADGRSAFEVDSTQWREQHARLAAEGVMPGAFGAFPLAAAAATDLDALLWRPAIAGVLSEAGDRPPRRPPGPSTHPPSQARKCHH